MAICRSDFEETKGRKMWGQEVRFLCGSRRPDDTRKVRQFDGWCRRFNASFAF
jgi:hypothetical protein